MPFYSNKNELRNGEVSVFFYHQLSAYCLGQIVFEILKESIRLRLPSSLREDMDKRGEILENFKKTNLRNDY